MLMAAPPVRPVHLARKAVRTPRSRLASSVPVVPTEPWRPHERRDCECEQSSQEPSPLHQNLAGLHTATYPRRLIVPPLRTMSCCSLRPGVSFTPTSSDVPPFGVSAFVVAHSP